MEKLGLIAGNGRFPFYIADYAGSNKREVVAVGLKDETDPGLQRHVSRLYWTSIGSLSKIISIFKNEGVSQAVMAGQVKHKKLYYRLFLDSRALKILAKIKDKRTDSILKAVADEFMSEGIELLPSSIYLKDFFPGKGMLAKSKPSKDELRDIEFGFKIAKQLADLDLGQTVVVKDQAAAALEALEGTDECILRGGALASKPGEPSGVVVVKVAKPKQDPRFDIPVMGGSTVDTLIKARGRVLAFEAGKTLVFDREEMIRKADENNICIIGV